MVELGRGRGGDAPLREVLAGATVVAQGDATAEAAAALGLALRGTLPLAVVDARAQLDRLTGGLTGARVAVQTEAGPGPVRPPIDLVAGLVAAGIDVAEVAVPAATPAEDPQAARRLVEAVVEGRVGAVTFTAPDEVRAFARLAEHWGAWDEARTVLGEVVVVACVRRSCVGAATSVGIRSVVRPERPRVGAMVDVLGARLETNVVCLELGGPGGAPGGAGPSRR